MKRYLNLILLLLTFIYAEKMKAQDWINYDEDEVFPIPSYKDIMDAYYPSYDYYMEKISKDYSKLNQEFGFKPLWFDLEQCENLTDYSDLIDSVLTLLPAICNYKVIRSYTDESSKKWTIEVSVNDTLFKFSTYALGGELLDSENLINNLKKLVRLCAPDYKVVVPALNSGQDMELLIIKTEDLSNLSKKGFSFPLFKIAWENKIPKNWNLYFPDCISLNEEELIKLYIQTFNEFHKDAALPKMLNSDNFHICDIRGNGQIYIFLNGEMIGSPFKNGKLLNCGPFLSEFLFGYTLAMLNGCEVYLDDINEHKRRLISLIELKEIIKNGLTNN